MRSIKMKSIMGVMLASLVVTAVPCAVPAKADNQTGPAYSCTVEQTYGEDTDFRAALSYSGELLFNVCETEVGNPASTKSMQISQGTGSYNISYIAGITTSNIRLLSLDTNLYDGTKLQLQANTITVTDVNGASTKYNVGNSIWTHKDGDAKAPYSLIIRNANYFYPNANGKPSANPVDAFGGQKVEVKALSKITLNFTVTRAANDSYVSDITTDSETFLATKGVKAKAATGKIGGITKNCVKVSWAKNSAATTYNIYRSTDNKTYKLLATGSGTSYTDSNVAPNLKYYYRVRAYGYANGEKYYGGFSAAASVKTYKKMVTPTFSAKKKSGVITFNVNKADGNKIQIQYKKNGKWKTAKSATVKDGQRIVLTALDLKKTIKIRLTGNTVRIRTYIKEGKKTYTSKWSKAIKA